MTWNYRLNQWIWGSLDLVFPPTCGGCGRSGYRWCPDCQTRVHVIPEPVCEICGEPIRRAGKCGGCMRFQPPYHQLRSWLLFDGPIRQALHSLKYKNNLPLGDSLANQMAEFTRKLAWPVEVIIPVPLGKNRMKERGYNQVGLVGMPLAHLNKWEYSPRGLIHIRDTQSQVDLSAVERRTNVAGAFQGNRSIVQGKVVLVFDDVATTGSTISACADALNQAGARQVYAITIARAAYQ